MNPFFSIISTQTNSFSNEKIAIGLIFISEKTYFNYSKTKLNWLKKLNNGNDFYTLAHSSLKKIEKAIEKENKSQNPELFKNLLSEDYFLYLNQYSSGIVTFSKPASIDILVTQSVFENYYEKIIGEPYKEEGKTNLSFSKKIKVLFNNKGADKFADIDYVMKANQIDGILKDYTLPFITKNGSVQAIEAIDFSQKKNTIISNIYEAEVFYIGLQKFCKSNNLNIIPIKLAIEKPTEKEETKFFNFVYKEKKGIFDFKEYQEVENFIEEAANSGKYHKFSDSLKMNG